MTKKPETLDCIEVKRRPQRGLAKALAGKTPEEQVESLRRIVARTPLWAELKGASPERPRTTARTPCKQRSTAENGRA
jgi:hypothetical protein